MEIEHIKIGNDGTLAISADASGLFFAAQGSTTGVHFRPDGLVAIEASVALGVLSLLLTSLMTSRLFASDEIELARQMAADLAEHATLSEERAASNIQ